MASSSILVNQDVWEVLAKIHQEELSRGQLQPEPVGDFLKIHINYGNKTPYLSAGILREKIIKMYDQVRSHWKIITFKSEQQFTLYIKYATEEVKGIVGMETSKSSVYGVVIRCANKQVKLCVEDCSVVDKLVKLATQIQETALSNEQSSSAEDTSRNSEVSSATARVNSVNNNGQSQQNVLERRASHPNTSLGNPSSMTLTRRNSQDPQKSGNKETNTNVAAQNNQTSGSREQVKAATTNNSMTVPTTTNKIVSTTAMESVNKTKISACSNASEKSNDNIARSKDKPTMFPKKDNETEGSSKDNQQMREQSAEAPITTKPDSQRKTKENLNNEDKSEQL